MESERTTTSQKIHNLLAPYDSSTTECDGIVRLCHTVLVQHHIEHQPMIGILTKGHKEISPHFWIELPSGECIDYRARMWLGNSEEVPHGVFQPTDFPSVNYEGEPVELVLLSPVLFKILTLEFDYGKLTQEQ